MDGSLVIQMVKRPRKVMRYSPSAGKHTEHTVERVKKRRASELKWGSEAFQKSDRWIQGFPTAEALRRETDEESESALQMHRDR